MIKKDLTKYLLYREKSLKKQREKFFSEENIKKRREKQIKYRENSLKNKTKISRTKIRKFSSKMINLHKEDAKFYQKIWNERPHYCENCGKFLGDSFFDENGKIINLFRYAHIITKTKYPLLRHNSENLMLLCLDCHTKFDNSPLEVVEEMNCYDKDKIVYLKQLHKRIEDEK